MSFFPKNEAVGPIALRTLHLQDRISRITAVPRNVFIMSILAMSTPKKSCKKLCSLNIQLRSCLSLSKHEPTLRRTQSERNVLSRNQIHLSGVQTIDLKDAFLL